MTESFDKTIRRCAEMTEEQIISAIRSGGRAENLALKALYDST